MHSLPTQGEVASPSSNFTRSRLIVKRLKRMRTKTFSLVLPDDSDGSGGNISDELQSLPYSVNFGNNFKINSITNGTDQPQSLPYEVNFAKQHSVHMNGSEREIVLSNTPLAMPQNEAETIDTVARGRITSDESDLSITYSLLEDDADDNEVKNDVDIINDAGIEQFGIVCGTPLSDLIKDDNILNMPHKYKKIVSPPLLLEEIEDSLPGEYSLKKDLFCPYSVITYRMLSRLKRIMPYNNKYIPPKNGKFTEVKHNETIKAELNRLQFELGVQEKLLGQAKKALSFSSMSRSRVELHLETETNLLLTCAKLKAIKNEMERLRKAYDDEEYEEGVPGGVAEIREITVTIEEPAALNSTYLICVAVERDNVKSSTLRDCSGNETKRFGIPLVFHNLPSNFTVTVYLYGIDVKDSGKKRVYSKSDLFLFGHRRSPKKYDDVEHTFILHGSCRLELSHLNSTELMFLAKSQSLGQAMKLHVAGNVFLETLHEGFLDVMRVGTDGRERISAWDKKWYRLTGLGLEGWNYPSQLENSETSSDIICLKQSISTEVTPLSMELCQRPHAFVFTISGEDGKLVNIVCAADTKQTAAIWCKRLNVALRAARTWHVETTTIHDPTDNETITVSKYCDLKGRGYF